MSDDTPIDDDAGMHRQPRALVAAVVGVLAIGGALLMSLSGDNPNVDPIVASGSSTSTSTSIASTTTTTSTITLAPSVPTSTLAALTMEFSPFVRADLVSTTRAIPENPPAQDAATTIYVDPVGGDDASPGTLEAPVASLEAARSIARRALPGANGDVVVYLRGGVHSRDATFTLSFRDSGQGGHDMVYRSYPGEQAVLEGGVPIGGWQSAYDSVMVAAVPDSIDDMRQFFAAGGRQQRARSASAIGTAIEFVTGPLFNQQRNVAMTVDNDLIEGLSDPESLELVYVGVAVAGHGQLNSDGKERLRPSWKAHRLPVDGVTDLGDGTSRLDIGNGALHHASERGYEPLELLPIDPFFLENALELLDEPGEWYFDQAARLLYWWPPSETAMADAWIPVTETLLNLDGTPDQPVRNVRFEGIAFRHAAYTLPNQTGYVVSQAASWFTGWRPAEWMEEGEQRHSYLDGIRLPGMPGAAVQLDSARDITFTGNVFTELGAVGVMLHNDVVRGTFEGNLFVDISAAALVAGHSVHDEIDEPMEGPIVDLVFVNNIVDRAAAEFYASVGVQVTKARGAVLSHNLFRDLPYSALSLGWGWNNNPNSTEHRAIMVENNYFENVVNTLYDGAPVYLLGPVAEPGAARRDFTQIRGNFANNAGAGQQFRAAQDPVDPGFSKRPGIQLDEGARNTLISDNVIVGHTVWLQVTAWRLNQNVPGWSEALGLIGQNNWSDTLAAQPADTTVVGVDTVQQFDVGAVPPGVLAIISGAGLEPGTEIPPLPR